MWHPFVISVKFSFIIKQKYYLLDSVAKTFYWGYLDSTFNCLAQKKKEKRNLFCYVSGFLGELWSNLCIMDWIIIKMILQIHKVLNRNKFTSQKVVLGRKNIFNPQLACLLLNPYFTQSSSWKEKMLNPQLACFLLNPFFLPMLKLCVCDVSMGDSGKHSFGAELKRNYLFFNMKKSVPYLMHSLSPDWELILSLSFYHGFSADFISAPRRRND